MCAGVGSREDARDSSEQRKEYEAMLASLMARGRG
jgi:hypothetical protein